MNDDDLARPVIAKLRVIAATAKEPICTTVLDAADVIERLRAELVAANEEIALLRGDDTGADARATYWQARCHALERDRARIEGDQ